MALIHILDKQSDKIIGTINLGEYTDDEKVTSSENENTFDFTALKKFDLLQKRNRLLLQDKDGYFSEYIIIYAEQNSRNKKFIKSNATFTDLQKAKIIEPQTLQGATSDTATTKALEGTEWQKGKVDYNGIRTLKIEEYTNPYDLLKRIASEFGLDLRFRVAVEGNKIIRYVDLALPDDEFDGKEVVFGKELIGLRRIEDAQSIVTALLVLGPEQEDGKRLTVLVEDNVALQRWGRNGQHLIGVYEPQITAEEVTVERLRKLGQNALQKRIDTLVTYECQAAILEHIPGKEHEEVRLDRTIRIKDEGYTPPLYLEAKVLEIKEQPSTGKILDFKLGKYKEFSKADLEAQIAGLKKLLAQKASNAKLVETYKLALKQAEEKAAQAEENAKSYTDTVKVQVVEHANTVANQAENNAKEHADTVAGEAESKAKSYALSEADKARIAAIQAAARDAQTKVNEAKTTLEASIAEKANAEWVNGQLVSKADKNNTYTKTEVDNALDSKVSNTTYTSDKDGIVTKLENHESRIIQNEIGLLSKVESATYEQKVSELETKVDNIRVDGKNLLRNSNDFTNLGNFSGAQYSYKTGVAVSEWDATDATEIHVTGGDSAIKLTKSIVAPSVAGQEYTLSVWVKNIGEYPVIISANIPGKEDAVNPGESKRVIINGKGNGNSYFQLNIKTSQENIGKPLDFIIWRCKGEKGNIATDWTPALEDTEAKITAIETRMSTAETNIQQTASDIKLKANKTDVYTKTETNGQISSAVNTAKGEIKVTTDSISQSVSSLQSTVNSQGTRLSSAESSITSLGTQIQSKVTQSQVDTSITNSKRHPDTRNNNQPPSWYWTNFPRQSIEEFKLTSVVGAPKGETYGTLITVVPWTDSSGGAIKQTFRTGPYNFERVSNGTSAWTAWIELENTAGSQAKVNSLKTDEIDPLKTRVSSAESTITQQAGLIASKAESSTVTALGNRVTTAEQNINGLTGQISQKVSKTDYNGNSISSLINQTATTIKLQAAKIALDGYVEAKHIKSLNGLNVGNGQFVVDKNGNVKFTGNLEGASGTFNGALTTNHLEIGPSSPDFPWYSDGSEIVSVLEMKNPTRITDGRYDWGQSFKIELLGNNNGVRISYPGDLYMDGSLLVEENRVLVDRQTQLWRGTAFMNASQTAKPSKKLRECNQGWVLVWQEYTSGESNAGWQYTFIPKFVLNVHEGRPISILLSGYDGAYCRKILYVYDDRITGHDQNGMYTPATLSMSHIFEF